MKRLSPGIIIIAVLLLAAAARASGQSETLMERRFLWNQANALMTKARDQSDFTSAAETYAGLVRTGVHNGHVFYNLGLALMLSGNYEQALKAFYRAERYAGSDEDILQNMRLCLAGGAPDATVTLPWYRFLLFWHFGLPGMLRLTVASAAFSACWLAMLPRRTVSRQAAEALLAVSLAVFILFASSAATTLHQEHRDSLLATATETVLEQPPPVTGGVSVSNENQQSQ